MNYFSQIFHFEIISHHELQNKFLIFNGWINLKKKKKTTGVYRCTDGNQSVHDESSIWRIWRKKKGRRYKFLAIKVDRAWRFNDRWSQFNSGITKAQVRTIKVKMPVGFQFSILFQAWQKSGACGGYLINVPFLRGAISSRSKKVGR